MARRRSPVSWLYLAAPLLLFLVIPLAAILSAARPGEVWAQLSSELGRDAIIVSLKTSLVSLGLILVFGTPLGYLVAKSKGWFRKTMETLVELPIVLPPSVAGLALLLAFGRNGLLGSSLSALSVTIPFTAVAVVLAQIFVAAPFFLRSAIAAFASVDPDVEANAELDGATGSEVLLQVTVPIASRQLSAGATVAWARALGEFGATLIFAGNLQGITQTMPLAIYLGFESDLDLAIALSVALLMASLVFLMLAKLLQRD